MPPIFPIGGIQAIGWISSGNSTTGALTCATRRRLPSLGGVGGQQGQQVGAHVTAWIQPQGLVFRAQDDRHPVVDRAR